MVIFENYPYTFKDLQQRVRDIHAKHNGFHTTTSSELLPFVDLTSLNGTDHPQIIGELCKKAIHKGVAAVCVYMTFLQTAAKALQDTNIRLATVAGCFPSGQAPLSVKTAEVEFALENRADEVDIVINRGQVISGNLADLTREIAAIKEICGNKLLKVILETGELSGTENIRKASECALIAGADFLKTSTGKTQPAATPEASLIMIDTIKEFYLKTGKKVGFKAAGGISSPEMAWGYYRLAGETLGDAWLTPDLFRIGASRLVDAITNDPV